MIRLMSQDEIDRQLPLVLAYPAFQKSGLRIGDIELFKASGALTIVALAEVFSDPMLAPDWARPFAVAKEPLLVPRGMILCQWLNPSVFQTMLGDWSAWQNQPPRQEDQELCLFLTIVNSTARNGMARLAIALSEAVEANPSIGRLDSLVWGVRSAKGQAMNEYFHGQPTGQFITIQRVGEVPQPIPVYRMPRADWRRQVDGMIEKLVGFEDHFTDELTNLHLQLLGKVPS